MVTSTDFPPPGPEQLRPPSDVQLNQWLYEAYGWQTTQMKRLSGPVPFTTDQSFILSPDYGHVSPFFDLEHTQVVDSKVQTIRTIDFHTLLSREVLVIMPTATTRNPYPSSFDPETIGFIKGIIPTAYEDFREQKAELLAKREAAKHWHPLRRMIGVFRGH